MFREYLWTIVGQRDPLVTPESLPDIYKTSGSLHSHGLGITNQQLGLSRHGWQGNSVQDSVPSLLGIQDQAIDWTSTCRRTFIDPECLSGHWFWLCSSMFPEMNYYWTDYRVVVLSRVEGAAMV